MNKLFRSKQGQIFTLIAVALITLLFVSYTIYSSVSNRSEIKDRIKTMNSYLFSLERDLERQVYVAGFRTILKAQSEIISTGEFFNPSNLNDNNNDGNTDFNDYFYKEFFNNDPLCSTGATPCINEDDLMNGARLIDLFKNNENSVTNNAAKMNIEIVEPDYDNPVGWEIKMFQEDPWHVTVQFTFPLKIKDKTGLARWEKTESINTTISIAHFYDPVYIRHTSSYGSRMVRSPIEDFTLVDVDDIVAHMKSGNYTQDDDAPCFLKKFEGKTSCTDNDGICDFVDDTPDKCENGIERLIDVSELENQGVDTTPYDGNSIVDYQYFSGTGTDICTIDLSGGTESYPYSWFKLDDKHRAKYDLSCT